MGTTLDQSKNARYEASLRFNATAIRELKEKIAADIDNYISEKKLYASNNDNTYPEDIKGELTGDQWQLSFKEKSQTQSRQYLIGEDIAQGALFDGLAVANEFGADYYQRLVDIGTLSAGTSQARIEADINEEITLAQSIITKKQAELADIQANGLSWDEKPNYKSYLLDIDTNIS